MRIPGILVHATVGLILLAGPANALDVARFNALASETVRDLNNGDPDIAALIERQEELVAIGVEGCRKLLAQNPEAAQVMQLVIDGADRMMLMDLDEIEEAWHEGGVLAEHGVDFDDLDHFGPVVSHMDSVVHPATAYILLKAYQKDRDRAHLHQVKEELSEVIEHIKHL